MCMRTCTRQVSSETCVVPPPSGLSRTSIGRPGTPLALTLPAWDRLQICPTIAGGLDVGQVCSLSHAKCGRSGIAKGSAGRMPHMSDNLQTITETKPEVDLGSAVQMVLEKSEEPLT